MTNRLSFDSAGRVEDPVLVLGTKSGKKLGVLNTATNIVFHKSLSGADELSFDVDKLSNGTITSVWDKVETFKTVWYETIDEWFEIAVELDEADETVKHVKGVALCESELSQLNLYDTEINTEDDIARAAYTEPTIFYNTENHKASLLHRLLDKAPHYTIEHVDDSLANIQRSFSFNDKTIYDALLEVAEEINCLFIFNSSTNNGKIARGIRAYDLESHCLNCGKRFETGDVCPDCGSTNIVTGYGNNTGIVISVDNLAEDINFTTDDASVKNCFRLEGGDDLMTAAIRMCNPTGSNYIWHITDKMKEDMTDELVAALDEQEALMEEYMTAHDFTVDAENYNTIIEKYVSTYPDLQPIASGGSGSEGDIELVNFPALVNAYFSANDFASLLQTSMMPSVDTTVPPIEDQIESIEENVTQVAILNLSDATSTSTIETAVRSTAKLYANSGVYKISVTTSDWDNPTWTGTVTLTAYDDSTKTATTDTLTVTATSDAYAYSQQMIAQKLAANQVEKYDIVSLFDKELAEFTAALNLYSVDCLSAFRESCQTCIDVLIEQGIGDAESTLYDEVYVPWRAKLNAIDVELSLREEEVAVVDEMIEQLEELLYETHETVSMENCVSDDLWLEFIAYRREDTYSNENYISDGLTNAELIDNAQRFLETANKELYKSANLQHSISATLSNLLMMPEFAGIVDQFIIGNWIYILVDEVPYKLRLIDYEISFDDLQRIDVTFSDVMFVLGGISDIKSILNDAQSMAGSYGSVSRQAAHGSAADKEIRGWVKDGLDATNAKIVSNSENQEMQFDGHGLLLRRYDNITERYHDEQIKASNNSIAFTTDNWNTVSVALGRIIGPNGDMLDGLIAKNLIGELLAGERLVIKATNDDDGLLFQVDSTGAWIKNGTLALEGSDGKILLDPAYGILAGGSDLYVADGTDFTADPTKANFRLDLSTGSAYFKGEIEAGSGNIGGWDISADKLSSGTGTTYVGLSSSGNSNYAIWAGNETPANAKFSVDRNGNVKMAGSLNLSSASSITWGSNNPAAGCIGSSTARSIASTVITNTLVSAPTIEGAKVIGSRFYGGAFNILPESYSSVDYDTIRTASGEYVKDANGFNMFYEYGGDLFHFLQIVQAGGDSPGAIIDSPAAGILQIGNNATGVEMGCQCHFYGRATFSNNVVDFSSATSINWGSNAPVAVFG